jgi:serine/threonine protein phosphatase PrpC
MASDGFWDEADETIYNSIFHCEKAENMAFNLYSSLRRRPRDNSTVICVRLL